MSNELLPLFSDDQSVEQLQEMATTSSDAVVFNLMEDISCLKEQVAASHIPEGFALVEVNLVDRVALDAHDNAYGALQEHDQSLGRTTGSNRRTAEEYESQIVDAAKLILMIKKGNQNG